MNVLYYNGIFTQSTHLQLQFIIQYAVISVIVSCVTVEKVAAVGTGAVSS